MLVRSPLVRSAAICQDWNAMCGRFSLSLPAEAVARLFGVDDFPNRGPRYNIGPSQEILVVRRRESGKGREIASMRWGFVPAWARNPATMHRPVNARAETVSGKPMFRDAFRRRRCLIPADGFYAWQQTGSGKRPWRVVRADGAPFAFAGLWERWNGPVGGTIESCVIITTEANNAVRPMHDSMPVILEIGRFEAWLSGTAVDAAGLLEPYRGALSIYPVSRRVNNPRNDDPGLVEPIEPAQDFLTAGRMDPEPKLI